jgi:hypothetical protein
MTDRPILFSAEMVRAILDGRKTQTRRVMKVQPWPDSIVTVEHYHPTVIDRHGDMQPGPEIFGAHWDDGEYGCRSPYGAPGDMLWVREAWRAWSQYDDWPPSRLPPGVDVQYIADASAPWSSRYRSPRYMPRWASRITLEVKGVRVERLHDITEDDARAEGAMWHDGGTYWHSGWRHDYSDVHADAYSSFARFWNNINGPDAWEENPYVWVISFQRVKP